MEKLSDTKPNGKFPSFSELPEKKKFTTHFSDIQEVVNKNLKSYLKILYIKYVDYEKTFQICDEKISKIIPQWKTMSSFNHHSIALHVYKMLYSIQKDPEFKNFSEFDQNIILWTTLLHDIAKRGKPIIMDRDYAHPFNSAGAILHIFSELKFFEKNEKLLDKWDKIIGESIILNKYEEEIHDNGKLPEIYSILCEFFPEDCMEKEVILLSLLHQSLPTLPRFNYHVKLEPMYEEIPKYFTKKRLELMKLIIKHDSLSYLIGGKTWNKKEVSEKFDQIIEELMEKSNWN